MKISAIVKKYLGEFSGLETVFFSFSILFALFLSVYMKDNLLSTISAVCGLSYTILAGKGRIFCYYIGITGTLCYCVLSYKNGFFGNCLLYGLYYLPMEITGIFMWKKHLKENLTEIKKTCLIAKERLLYFSAALFLAFAFFIILKYSNDPSPFIDSFTTVFSVLGLYLTVRRCIEQWYIWFIINLLSTIMWAKALINGALCAGTVVMWLIYTILAVYFLWDWKKELKN